MVREFVTATAHQSTFFNLQIAMFRRRKHSFPKTEFRHWIYKIYMYQIAFVLFEIYRAISE